MPEDTPEDQPRSRPASCTELFGACTRLALQGFGGVLPVAQRELVERTGWLTQRQFLETLAVAQVLPGPNIINMGLMIGDRFFGWRGAVAAVGGMMLLPLVLVLILAVLAGHAGSVPAVAGALRGMAVVAAGLIVSTAIKLMPALRHNPLGPAPAGAFGAAALLAVGGLRWPLAWVVLALGAAAVWAAWWRLDPDTTAGSGDRRDGDD
jgi:chromate transporter